MYQNIRYFSYQNSIREEEDALLHEDSAHAHLNEKSRNKKQSPLYGFAIVSILLLLSIGAFIVTGNISRNKEILSLVSELGAQGFLPGYTARTTATNDGK
jgi:hypothetical protein